MYKATQKHKHNADMRNIEDKNEEKNAAQIQQYKH